MVHLDGAVVVNKAGDVLINVELPKEYLNFVKKKIKKKKYKVALGELQRLFKFEVKVRHARLGFRKAAWLHHTEKELICKYDGENYLKGFNFYVSLVKVFGDE